MAPLAMVGTPQAVKRHHIDNYAHFIFISGISGIVLTSSSDLTISLVPSLYF
jgi:hypothetical protein